MNMVVTLLEMKPDAPALSMCVPPRLRRVRPSPMSSAGPALDFRVWPGVLGVAGLGAWVSWALAVALGVAVALAVALAEALVRGVALLLRDPWPKGVLQALAIWDEPEVGLKCHGCCQWTNLMSLK